MGQGPMTGRMAGFCAGYENPGFVNAGWGRGGGGGFGRGGRGRGGYGFRNRYHATGLTGWQRAAMVPPGDHPAYAAPIPAMTREQEVEAMKRQAGYLEGALGDLRKRIEEIEGEKT